MQFALIKKYDCCFTELISLLVFCSSNPIHCTVAALGFWTPGGHKCCSGTPSAPPSHTRFLKHGHNGHSSGVATVCLSMLGLKKLLKNMTPGDICPPIPLAPPLSLYDACELYLFSGQYGCSTCRTVALGNASTSYLNVLFTY
jgi:hypothetical protein